MENKQRPIIALDVDDVLCQFSPHSHTFYGHEVEKCDYWCPDTMNGKFGEGWFTKIAPVREFWETLPVLSPAEDIDFEFDYYMSAFPEDMYQLRVDWLKKHGYPDKPLIVTFDKLSKCLELGVDYLVDDKPATIKMLEGTPVKGIHFYNHYAGFKPVGNYITTLKDVKYILELENEAQRV